MPKATIKALGELALSNLLLRTTMETQTVMEVYKVKVLRIPCAHEKPACLYPVKWDEKVFITPEEEGF